MNIVECVIEGYGIDIEVIGCSVYIKIIYWCLFFFILVVFYLLILFIEYCRKEGWLEKIIGREYMNIIG